MTILEKRDYYLANKKSLSPEVLKNYEDDFCIRYSHNSTAIEGNTLTLMETKLVIEDKISVGGKDMREIYEVVNHNKAYSYIKKCIADKKPLDENIIKEIHYILMENIMVGGIYRNVDVYISGSQHTPPNPSEMYNQIKNFYIDLKAENKEEKIEFAAWTHAEFVKIHPFVDGNGRTSRLILNYLLMANGYLPISISKETRLDYFAKLEEYALNGNIAPFADFIADLEEKELDKYIKAIGN